MKVASINLNPTTVKAAKPQEEEEQSPEELEKAQNAEALVKAALNQLYYADPGSDTLYLQNAKKLAELADFTASSISQPTALKSAKNASASALYALGEADKLEGQQKPKLALLA